MMRMRENAESVAFYSGEKQEGGVFKKRFKLLLDNFWKIVEKQKQLVWLNSGYSQIAIIFPFVVAMPRYLSKEITLGGLIQIASAFGRVQESLSYFVDMYASLAEWRAVVERQSEVVGAVKVQDLRASTSAVSFTEGKDRIIELIPTLDANSFLQCRLLLLKSR